jgi:sulfur relay (sulfurtransferase) complex TusBCD TusD component (DsrE family)
MSQRVVVAIFNPGSAPEHNGQTIHALKLAKALAEAGAEVELLFEGKGVTWLPRFLDRSEDSHPFVKNYGAVFDAVRPLAKACNMCCKRFDVRDAVAAAEIPILGEGSDHVDVARYVLDGYQVINH